VGFTAWCLFGPRWKQDGMGAAGGGEIFHFPCGTETTAVSSADLCGWLLHPWATLKTGDCSLTAMTEPLGPGRGCGLLSGAEFSQISPRPTRERGVFTPVQGLVTFLDRSAHDLNP